MPTKKCLDTKNANMKRCNLLNQKKSMSNILLSETNIMCMHITYVNVIIITRLIIDISQRILNVEHGGYAI